MLLLTDIDIPCAVLHIVIILDDVHTVYGIVSCAFSILFLSSSLICSVEQKSKNRPKSERKESGVESRTIVSKTLRYIV